MIVIALLSCLVLVWCLAPLAAVGVGRAFHAGATDDIDVTVGRHTPAA